MNTNLQDCALRQSMIERHDHLEEDVRGHGWTSSCSGEMHVTDGPAAGQRIGQGDAELAAFVVAAQTHAWSEEQRRTGTPSENRVIARGVESYWRARQCEPPRNSWRLFGLSQAATAAV